VRVLPGVDIAAQGNSEGVGYDFRRAPGVGVRDLRREIASDRAKQCADVRLGEPGDLFITLDGREMRRRKPASYEEWAASGSHATRRRQIDGGYGLAADGSVVFHVAAHDPHATLVLDPSLTVAHATFLGGTSGSALERSGGVVWQQRRNGDVGSDASGNLHDDAHRNVHRHRRKHNAQRASNFDHPVALR
jgi:hypothetical protein